MSIKNLFFTSDQPEEEVKQSIKTKFPDATKPSSTVNDEVGQFKFPEKIQGWKASKTVEASCSPHIEKVVDMYEKGFDSLNLQGYDFYEMYKAVQSAGVDNPLAYTMAFNMGKGMDSSVTKQKILEQADYYLNEIEKVHGEYKASGELKRQQLEQEKEKSKQQTTIDIRELRGQIEKLNQNLREKETELKLIDSKFDPQLEDLSCKVMANDVAKDRINESIIKVKQGIQTNVN